MAYRLLDSRFRNDAATQRAVPLFGERRMSNRIRASVVAAMTAMLAGQAHADTILNFENGEFPGLVAMGNSPGAAVPTSAQLSNQFLASVGASFSSGTGFVAVVDHDAVYTPSPPNVIGGTSGGALDYNSPIFVAFFLPSDTSTPAITNFVQVLGDLIPDNSGSATLTAFDASGTQIGSITQPDFGPPGTGLTLSLSVAGIHSLEITEITGTIGFDNFEFGDLTAVPAVAGSASGVPEPATWTVMLLGLAGVGFMAHRRRSKTSS